MSDLRTFALRPVLERHGIGLAVLFGSRARGAEHEGSDLGLGIEHRDGPRLGLLELGRLRDDLSEVMEAEIDLMGLPRS